MKYACLVYLDSATMARLTPAEGRKLNDASMDYDTALSRDGFMLMGQPLQPPETAVTIRVRNGKLSSTDGPFAETKEFLAGFFLLETKDLDEAVRLAAKSPLAPLGNIEIRPFMDREHS